MDFEYGDASFSGTPGMTLQESSEYCNNYSNYKLSYFATSLETSQALLTACHSGSVHVLNDTRHTTVSLMLPTIKSAVGAIPTAEPR